MNETDLIHMNGRTYDYNLGRFLSVDPVIQAPQNSQSLNPYSYIMNNPLSGTDPTGYTSFGLNGGKCGDFTTGSCDSIIINDGSDERANRQNGAQGTQGTTSTNMTPSDLGAMSERDNNGSGADVSTQDSGFQTFPCRCERNVSEVRNLKITNRDRHGLIMD